MRLSEYFYEHTHDGGSFDSAERQSLKREREKKAEGKKRVLAERGFSPEGVETVTAFELC